MSSLYPLKIMEDVIEMKISEKDLNKIISEHFGDKVCLSVIPKPKKKSTHFVLKLYPKTKEAK